MSIESIVKGAPLAGREFLDFLIRPGRLADRHLTGQNAIRTRETVSWCIACMLLVIWGNSQLVHAGKATSSPPSGQAASAEASPRLVRVHLNWQPRLDFLERTDEDETPVFILSLGSATAEVVGLTSQAAKSSLLLCVFFLYGLSFALCIHPVAILLRARQEFKVSLSFATLLVTFSALQMTLLTALLVILRVSLALTDATFWVTWALLVAVPSLVTTARAYFVGLGRLYGFSGTRCIVATVGAAFASMFIGPGVYLPGLWLILSARRWLEVIL